MGVVCLGVCPLAKRSMLHHWDGNISKSLIYAFVTACYSGGVIMFLSGDVLANFFPFRLWLWYRNSILEKLCAGPNAPSRAQRNTS